MNLYHYPKAQHKRAFSPRVFKNYRTYKRWLQQEFNRVCVYCREPDTLSTNLNFGVDHYRPKSISRFASLACDYTNLYYCCGNCNSRKKADWPADEANGPYVVNPCDHVMADHIRFNVVSGEMDARSAWGEHMRVLLQLNDPASVAARKNQLLNAKICGNQIDMLKQQLDALRKKLNRGEMTQQQYDNEMLAIEGDINDATQLLNAVTGATPLPTLSKHKMALQLQP